MELQLRLEETAGSDLWPEAPIKDAEKFSHLNVKFDLDAGTVEVETLAKDNSGDAFYSYQLDSADQAIVEV